MSGYWTGILSILAINIVFAYGVFLPVAAGQLNLGGGGFQAIGAYTAAYLSANYGTPIALNFALAVLLGGGVGFAIAFPVSRTRGVYLVLATFAFAEVVSGVILNSSTLGGALGISVPDYVEPIVPISAAIIVTLIMFYLMSTRFGLAIRAIHDDEIVADLMGVAVRGSRVAAFALGGAFAGLSGAIYAHSFNFVEAHAFGAEVSIYVLLYVLVGGTQTAWGPLIGATFFTLLPEALRPLAGGLVTIFDLITGHAHSAYKPDESWRFVALGVLTVAVMVMRPGGLISRSTVERLKFRSRGVRLRTEAHP